MEAIEQDVQNRRLSLKFGLLNGLFLGLGLALGVWASDAIFSFTAPVRLSSGSLVLGGLALIILGGLGGWLAAQVARAWFGGLVWIAVGICMVWVIGHVPYEGRNLMVWLADRRAWGLPVYPFSDAAQSGMWLFGFFVLLCLGLLGFLQPYRMEGVAGEADDGGRLGVRGWFLLLLPLPLVFAVGLLADYMVNRPSRVAPQLVHEVIRTGRTYEGDLFELSRKEGANYNAIAGLQHLMSENYTLSLGDVDLGAAETVYVVADFDNGAWINCRVVMDQVAFCYDASPPYMRGLPAVITTGDLPEDCPFCSFSVSDDLRSRLHGRKDDFAGTPEVTRLAQWGSYVLVQAESPDREYAIQCLFEGLAPVQLDRCWEVKNRD